MRLRKRIGVLATAVAVVVTGFLAATADAASASVHGGGCSATTPPTYSIQVCGNIGGHYYITYGILTIYGPPEPGCTVEVDTYWENGSLSGRGNAVSCRNGRIDGPDSGYILGSGGAERAVMTVRIGNTVAALAYSPFQYY